MPPVRSTGFGRRPVPPERLIPKRDTPFASALVDALIIGVAALAAIRLTPDRFAELVLAVAVLSVAGSVVLGRRRQDDESRGTGRRQILNEIAGAIGRTWVAALLISVVGAAAFAGLHNAGSLATILVVFAPWMVIVRSTALRRRRRSLASVGLDTVEAIGRDAPAATCATVGILVSALLLARWAGSDGATLNEVFVSRGTVFLVGGGCIALVWSWVLRETLVAIGRGDVAATLPAVVVAVLFVTVTSTTVVLRTPAGSAYGFAVGGLIVVGGYLVTLPWSPMGLRARVIHATTRLADDSARSGRGTRAGIVPVVHEPAEIDRTAALRGYLGVCVFVVFAILIPGYVIGSIPSRSGNLWVVIMPVLVLASARLAWLVRRGERRLLEMTFWVFTYTFMGLAALAQIRDRSSPDTVVRLSWDLVPSAAGLVLFGAVAFVAGSYVASRMSQRTEADGNKDADTERVVGGTDRGGAALGWTVSYRKLLVFSMFTILLNLYYLAHVGVVQFTRSRIDALVAYDAVWSAGSAGVLILPATYMSLLVGWVAWMRLRRESQALAAAGYQTPPSIGRVSLFFVIVIGVLLANTMNPVSNARYLSGTAMLAAAVAFGLFSTPNRFRTMVVSFILALIVIFPLADAFRFSDSAEFKTSGPIESLLSADYDSFAQVTNGLLVAARDGIEPGRQFLGVVLWAYPRSAWPAKPEDTGILLANDRGYPFTNLSAPIWVEFYMNGGWILVGLGMAFLGYLFYRCDTAIDKQMQYSAMPTVLGTIIPFYLLILLRGSLLQAMSYLTLIIICALVVRARPGPVGGTFDRRWLPDTMRYADVGVRPQLVPARRVGGQS